MQYGTCQHPQTPARRASRKPSRPAPLLRSALAASFAAYLLLSTPVPCPAAETPDPASLTIEELLNEANNAFNAAEWARAATLYAAFLNNYSKAPEVAKLLTDLRYRLAVCYIRAADFAAATPAINEALASKEPPLNPQQQQELTFWRGIGQMREEQYADARRSFEEFIALFPNPQPKNVFWRARNPQGVLIPEAKLLVGATHLLEENHLAAADYLAQIKPELEDEIRGRATVLELYGLMAAAEKEPQALDRALTVIVEEFPRLGSLTQLAAFQTMTLQLGSAYLEQGHFRKAIRCLQRVWPAERILRHQKDRLAALEARRDALEANPRADAFQKFQVGQMITKVRREIENFERIPDFDAALRLRLASAYQAMDRFREAALIMEDMLARMQPSPIVESASLNLVQCWNSIQRHDRTIAAATRFQEVFPQSKHLPLVLYLRGIAEQQDQRYPDAFATFERLQKDHAQSEFAPRAAFMIGFTALLAEDNPRAIAAFTEFPKKHPQHELTEPALYWLGMAYSLNEESQTCRDVLAEYLKKYPKGPYASAAQFRRAYAAQQMMDFDTSIPELQAFLKDHPGHENEAEALILLADALMHYGRMEEGLDALSRVPKDNIRFYEEAVFKTGRALKAMEEFDRLYNHMLRFAEENPRSPRVPEAIYHAGWVLKSKGQDDAARDLYWRTIRDLLADPAARAVEDLFPALLRLYPGEQGLKQYIARIRDLRNAAASRLPEGEKLTGPVLQRTLWAEALAIRKSDPQAARLLLLDAARDADPRSTSPQLMADFADARLQIGDESGAAQLFADLIKWNPRAPQKDRALAELGFIALKRNRPHEALEHFQRFRRETFGSRHTGRVLLALAKLLHERGEDKDAIASLEELLASNASTGQEKAEALCQIGEIFMAQKQPAKAIPYFQRVYIMHGRWRDWVARAYWRSGEAFEQLKDTEAARRTYAELLSLPELSDFPEAELARARLEKLGGPLNPPQPAEPSAPAPATPEAPSPS